MKLDSFPRRVIAAAPELDGPVHEWAQIDGVDVDSLSAHTVFEVIARWLLGKEAPGRALQEAPATEQTRDLFNLIESVASSPANSEANDALRSSLLYGLLGEEENAPLIASYVPLMGPHTLQLAREASPTPKLDAALRTAPGYPTRSGPAR